MRFWARAGLALAFAVTAIPSFAQTGFGGGSEGETFLKAIREGDNAKAVPLVEEPGGRVVNYKGYDGDTALHIVTRKRELDWVGFLLKEGADPSIPDANGDTALHIAARIGFEPAADYMVRMGAKVDVANKRGETALIIAVHQRQPRIVELLLKAGANPDKSDHAAGYSARDYAKRDTRNPQLLKLIETVKSTKKKAAGPTIN
jgi:ankyrin repeat protein